MTEAELQREALRVYGAHPRLRLWRANAGRAMVATASGAMRPIQMNVDGCPDAIGFASVEVERLVSLAIPRVAVFTGLEFKSPRGRIRPAQQAFADVLLRFGGIHTFAWSMSDVDNAFSRLLK